MELYTAILPSRCSVLPCFSTPTPHATSSASPHSSPINFSLPFSRFNFCTKSLTLTRGRGLRLLNCVATTQEGSSRDVVDDDEDDDDRMIGVSDKLIGIFMVDKPTPTDWRRLLAFSRKWNNIRPHFFKRCYDRATAEDNPAMKERLHRLARKLKEIDQDVQRHNDLLNVIRQDQSEISNLVSKRRKDFTKEFFDHLIAVAQSYYDDAEKRTELAKLGDTCLRAVQAYDAATESIEQAQLKFEDIFNSPSVDAACRKIDKLNEKKELDSTLALMMTKAWSAAKETNMTEEEAKDILFHLYKTGVANLQRSVPKEVRIMKYIIQIEDPEEQLSALNDAFTPGEELEGNDVDCLYTTPEKLHTSIKTVVDAYHSSQAGTIVREARDLLNPEIVRKLEMLKKVVEGNFM